MSISELEKLIIPEESDEIKVPISLEIPIKISGIQNIDISSNDKDVIIKGSVDEIELNFSKTEHKSITIPDLNEPIRGTITVDPDTSVIELREIPIDEARALILDYITEHHGATTNDLIFELALDVDIVLDILKELNKKEEIMPV